jgi:hypothetical protein
LHTHNQNLYTHSATWIPFLAYQKGDVTENINKLSSSVSKASTILDDAKENVEKRTIEIDEIVLAAKEASASAGAAVFTEDFSRESSSNKTEADKWLKYAVISVIITFVVAALFWGLSYIPGMTPTDKYMAIQVIMAKVIMLSLLVSASFWCARNYRVLMHLSKHNNHRALSLKTLQAFFKSASDPQSKDAVLLEVTRSVFGNTATGYLGGKEESQNPSMNIVELSKRFGGVE